MTFSRFQSPFLLSDWDHLIVKGRRSQIKETGLFLSRIFFLPYANSGKNALLNLKIQVKKIEAREVHYVGKSHLAGVARHHCSPQKGR